MEKKYGLPVVNANNIFDVLAKLGIKPRKEALPPVDLTDYLKQDLTEAQLKEVERFAPKTEVVRLDVPDGVYTGFRTVPKDWATTFVLFPEDYVAIACEYKHGCGALTAVPPSGVLSKVDEGSMAKCALRETSEELGVTLERVIPLQGGHGVPISGRQNSGRYFPFLGVLPKNFSVGPSKLDKSEVLKMVLIPLHDWLTLIARGQTNEMCAGDVTYSALRQLGRLSMVMPTR